MAGISTSIRLADQMTPALRAMSASMNIVINTFETMQSASGRAVDTEALQAARAELLRIDSAAGQVGDGLREAAGQQGNLNRQLAEGGAHADGLMAKVKQLVTAYAGIKTVDAGVSFIQEATSAQDIQKQYETKLQTVMGQRMDAGQVEFQAVLDTASMQQQIGVIGDEVQLAGAGQLATFLGSTEALNTLIPAMDNLAASQKGCSASAEDLTNIGNMMGKVMQGQVGALTRVGVTFTEAQESALKYGDEQERAAVLAQVITDNVGQMNAAVANTPQGAITQMKNAWGDVMEAVGQRLYPAVMMVFRTLQGYMPQATAAVMGLADAMMPGIEWLATAGIPAVVDAASALLQMVSGVGSFISDSWGAVGPVILGLVGAFAAYNAMLAVQNAMLALHAFWTGTSTAATILQTIAQQGLNAAIAACPLAWAAIAIGAVIAAIAVWVGHVGGLRVAWQICVNSVLSAADSLKLAFSFVSMHIQDALASMQYAFASFKAGVLNALGNLKVAGLGILQGFINGAIDRINKLIELTNSIAGTSIQAVGHVEFAATAAIEEQRQRASDLAAMAEGSSAAAKARQQDYAWQRAQADAARDQREYEIRQLRAGNGKNAAAEAAAASYSPAVPAYEGIAGGVGDIAGNTGGTAGNTARMADAMDTMDEDLKYMRDAAEQEIINRFTLAELKVDVNNNNTLTKKADFDDMGRFLAELTGGILASAAEGGHL